MEVKYLLLGGGVAAHRAAETIRKGDANGSITIVSNEPHRLYSRVMLPHYLHGKVPREKVFLVKPEWYAEHRIEFIHADVVRVDPSVKSVSLGSRGSVLHYDKLLIATGGTPRMVDVPGTEFLPFRGLDDADRIAGVLMKLDALPERERVVGVYGAGFIATEFINLFLAHKCLVHVFFRGTRFWGRQLDEQSSKALEAQLAARGCVLHPNASFVDLLQWAPQLRCVGVGIGIVSAFEFLRDTHVKLDAGIRTNARLETNVPDVWAAGDIAEFDTSSGRPQLVGTWLNAEMQGRLVGRNMLGAKEEFALVTSYATKLLDVPVTMIGEVQPMIADKVEVSREGDGVVQKLYRDGKLIGASLTGTAHGRMEIQKAIGE